MRKRIIFIVALFFVLFPLCISAADVSMNENSSASELICRYNYKPISSVDVTFDISYNLQVKNVSSYKIVSDDSKFPSEIVSFNFNDDFANNSETYCPVVYVSYLVNDKTTRLHINSQYSRGLTSVTGKNVNSKAGSNSIKTTIKTDLFDSNCADFANTLKIGGLIIFFIKIILPLIIIVKSMIDFFSVVTSGKSEEFMKKMKKLAISLVSAILIFFVPTIVGAIFDIVTGIKGVTATNIDMEICKACLLEPFSSKCASKNE